MEDNKIHYNSIKDVSTSAWNELAKKKIYFGHQSVGFNIIDGIKDVMKENPNIKLNIIETSDPLAFSDNIFAHSRIGQNADSMSKVNEFKKFMDDGIGKKADMAFFKYCYVDITENTDINKIFNEYKNTMRDIKNNNPKTTFSHFTVPLRTTKTTWKTRLKKIMGKDNIWEYEANIRRNLFNELLIKEYKGKEPVFDIAMVESTTPDNKRITFEKDNKNYYSLYPGYTNDGGHLNEIGRKKVAEQLLLQLVNLN